MCYDDYNDYEDNEYDFIEYLLDNDLTGGNKLGEIPNEQLLICKDLYYDDYKSYCKNNNLIYERI